MKSRPKESSLLKNALNFNINIKHCFLIVLVLNSKVVDQRVLVQLLSIILSNCCLFNLLLFLFCVYAFNL